MVLTYFLKGILIGFTMAVPIGPIAVMAIRRTLAEGRLKGMIIGLGASSADMVYSIIAAFGLTAIADTIASEKLWLRLIGGGLLIVMGLSTFSAKPKDARERTQTGGLVKLFLSTFIITLTNPMTIFAFAAIFAGLGLVNEPGKLYPTALVAGVFTGSILWFVLLVSGVRLFRKRFDTNSLRWVNKIAGILLVASGLIAIGSLLT